MAYVVSASGARSGTTAGSEDPRAPPNPPSPRTKIEDRVVQRSCPSSDVTVASCQMTAAFPLSQTSVSVVVCAAVPDVGIGACTAIDWDPCTTWARLIRTPGISTDGACVSWNVGATTPNE